MFLIIYKADDYDVQKFKLFQIRGESNTWLAIQVNISETVIEMLYKYELVRW